MGTSNRINTRFIQKWRIRVFKNSFTISFIFYNCTVSTVLRKILNFTITSFIKLISCFISCFIGFFTFYTITSFVKLVSFFIFYTIIFKSNFAILFLRRVYALIVLVFIFIFYFSLKNISLLCTTFNIKIEWTKIIC